MSIYMEAEGHKGSVTTKNYQGAIELLDVAMNAGRNVSTRTGVGNDRETGTLSHSEITISKLADASSADLHQTFYTGDTIPKVEIHLCHDDKEKTPRIVYTLTDVIISRIHDSAVNEAAHTVETIGLNTRSIEKRYEFKDSNGKLQSPKTVRYNLDTATAK